MLTDRLTDKELLQFQLETVHRTMEQENKRRVAENRVLMDRIWPKWLAGMDELLAADARAYNAQKLAAMKAWATKIGLMYACKFE